MEKNINIEFKEYMLSLSDEQTIMIEDFLENIKRRCLVSKVDNYKIKIDFIKALLYYIREGFRLDHALDLIDPSNLGGFYARTSHNWFSLDDAAKIYPMSLEHGNMAIFRLSVYLKTDIIPELLQMALTFTIKRFPTFATTVKKGIFWHYFDTTKCRFQIHEENTLPIQPIKVSRSGSHSFRVIYYKNRISIEFFHILTDGMGGMTFLKALVREYLRLTGVNIADNGDIWDINDTPNINETRNEFDRVEHSENSSGLVNKRSLQMNGKLTKLRPNQILHFKMDADRLKEVARKYNITVTAYILTIMFIAIKASMDNLHGDLSIQVPINMRKFYPSNTIRNFAMYCGINLDIEDITTVSELSGKINQQLKEKTNKEKMGEMVTATNKLVRSIKFVPMFIKVPFARRLYGFLGDKAFVTTLSNIGVVNMPNEYKKYIISFDFILGISVVNRVACGLVTFNNVSTLSVTKMTKDPTFEEKLYKLIKSDGIDLTVEGSEANED